MNADVNGSAVGRSGRRSRAAGAFAAVLLGVALAVGGGCSIREHICRSGEYPVKAVGNRTGRTCVPNDSDPPSGYVRYPDGKVPRYVDDRWDRYWRTVVVDDHGNVVG